MPVKIRQRTKGEEGPIDSYKFFLNKGVINMNAGDAEDYELSDDEVNYHSHVTNTHYGITQAKSKEVCKISHHMLQ